MSRSFHPVDSIDAIVGAIAGSAATADVFIGVLPRVRRGGGREDLGATAKVLWVDCDTREATVALEAYRPRASMVVASGGGRWHRHAYWLLNEAQPLDVIERANRGLAQALGADRACVDAARILRPAGSLWWKSVPPRPVELLRVHERDRYSLTEVMPAVVEEVPAAVNVIGPTERLGKGDPLMAIAPAEYVTRLAGIEIGPDGKGLGARFITRTGRRACTSLRLRSAAGTASAHADAGARSLTSRRCCGATRRRVVATSSSFDGASSNSCCRSGRPLGRRVDDPRWPAFLFRSNYPINIRNGGSIDATRQPCS